MDEGHLIDQWREWRKAARHYERLADSEADAADGVGIEAIPATRQARVDRVSGAADFEEGCGNLPVA